MVRWVAFDDESAEAVVSRFKRGAAEIQPGDAVGSALELGRPSLVLLPGRHSGQVLMARFHPAVVEEVVALEDLQPLPSMVQESIPAKTSESASFSEEVKAADDLQPVAYETSGFLGLSDQPIYYSPEPRAKRKWWQKLTD